MNASVRLTDVHYFAKGSPEAATEHRASLKMNRVLPERKIERSEFMTETKEKKKIKVHSKYAGERVNKQTPKREYNAILP